MKTQKHMPWSLIQLVAPELSVPEAGRSQPFQVILCNKHRMFSYLTLGFMQRQSDREWLNTHMKWSKVKHNYYTLYTGINISTSNLFSIKTQWNLHSFKHTSLFLFSCWSALVGCFLVSKTLLLLGNVPYLCICTNLSARRRGWCPLGACLARQLRVSLRPEPECCPLGVLWCTALQLWRGVSADFKPLGTYRKAPNVPHQSERRIKEKSLLMSNFVLLSSTLMLPQEVSHGPNYLVQPLAPRRALVWHVPDTISQWLTLIQIIIKNQKGIVFFKDELDRHEISKEILQAWTLRSSVGLSLIAGQSEPVAVSTDGRNTTQLLLFL